LFPYPHPKAIGLILDPKERATVLRVEPQSLAAKAGFQAGDEIQSLKGQPLLSIADVQWALHNTPAGGGHVKAEVRRGSAIESVTLALPAGWRQADDISWRASSWELRRMGLGAMRLKNLTTDEAAEVKLPPGQMALKVEHVGQYAPHDIAKKAGVQKGDVLLSFDGRSDFARETDVLGYALLNIPPGKNVPITLLREGKKIDLTLDLQK
jgi:S1-C subfamily serine protease